MADPQTAVANPLRNIEVKTGKSFAELCLLIQTSGPSKVGEQRQMLMQQLGLGYGDANRLAIRAKDATAPKSADANPLDTLYSGNKAALHPLHDQLNAAIDALGPHEKAPKKLSLIHISLQEVSVDAAGPPAPAAFDAHAGLAALQCEELAALVHPVDGQHAAPLADDDDLPCRGLSLIHI